MTDTAASMDLARIMELLPHRYPFLLVDKILDIAPDGSSARGVKNVTYNEPFFPGHFPAKAVMPGVLIIEAMAQAAAAYTANHENFDMAGKVVFFLSIDNCRFRKPVVPGDQLNLHVSVSKRRPPIWKFHGDAKVDGTLCAEADFSAMLVDAQ